MLLLAISLIVGGCITPDQWSPKDHQKQMMYCRSMCGKGLVEAYQPYTGECSCHLKRSRR